jgi:hypothetical protein
MRLRKNVSGQDKVCWTSKTPRVRTNANKCSISQIIAVPVHSKTGHSGLAINSFKSDDDIVIKKPEVRKCRVAFHLAQRIRPLIMNIAPSNLRRDFVISNFVLPFLLAGSVWHLVLKLSSKFILQKVAHSFIVLKHS